MISLYNIRFSAYDIGLAVMTLWAKSEKEAKKKALIHLKEKRGYKNINIKGVKIV